MARRKCFKSGKVILATELDAKIALSLRSTKEKGEKRYYSCGNHFHLTSQDQRTEVKTCTS